MVQVGARCKQRQKLIGYTQELGNKMAKKKLPTPREVRSGDVLVHLSTSGRGQFTVTRVEGDWAWGEGDAGHGFYAVPISECVTPETARGRSKDIDRIFGRSLQSIGDGADAD